MKSFALILILSLASLESELPVLNVKVVEYLDSVMGKKVDRGECWDLAAGALAYSGAYFDRSSKKTVTIYGRLLNPKKENILPGDMIQFENVVVQYKKGNSTFTETMNHHTAVVYQVNDQGDFQMAHQNTSKWGKKVGVSNFNLAHVKKGKVMIYRPIKQKGK